MEAPRNDDRQADAGPASPNADSVPSATDDAAPGFRVPLHRSLQFKLFLPVFVGLVVLVSLQVKLILEGHRKQQTQDRERVLTSAAYSIQTAFGRMQLHEAHTRETVADAFEEAMLQSQMFTQGVRTALLSRDGVLLAEDDSLSMQPSEIRDSLAGDRPRLVESASAIGMVMPVLNWSDCRVCHPPQEPIGWIWVESSNPDFLIERIIRRTGFMTIAILSTVFGLTIWALMFGHVRRPLSAMGQVMDRVMKGDLAARFRVESHDELGHLGERLNRMVRELEVMQEQLQSANLQLMMRAERMVGVGEMASRLAHEIRNPLAGIQSVVSIFREDLDEDDPEREILGEALQQIQRIENTINDLLAFARPRPLHLEPVSLRGILEDLVLFCRNGNMTGAHRIELLPCPELPEVHADRDRLSQMFLNVVMNGLQAMQEPGVLTIRLERQGTTDGEDAIEVRIADTGPGIPDEVAHNLFKAFYTTRAKGTGLGLAISRSVAQQHGGSLVIARTGPEGTEFCFTIPVGEAGVDASAATAAARPDPGRDG
jgi:signal transduction histidine kinase